MGKKQNKSDANVHAVQNRDIMQRMNFLWQASVYLESLPGSSRILGRGVEGEGEGGQVGTKRDGKKERRERRRRTVDGSELARSYVQTMKSVGQRTTTKLDPGVKRTLCKGCSTTLVPGVTARVRVRSSASFGHCISYTCLECSTTRRIPAPRTIQPPLDDPSISTTESRVEDTTDVDISPSEAITRPRDHEVTPKEKKIVKKGRKKVVVRQQPLFARRSEGHVVFRGGEVADMKGVYCV